MRQTALLLHPALSPKTCTLVALSIYLLPTNFFFSFLCVEFGKSVNVWRLITVPTFSRQANIQQFCRGETHARTDIHSLHMMAWELTARPTVTFCIHRADITLTMDLCFGVCSPITPWWFIYPGQRVGACTQYSAP